MIRFRKLAAIAAFVLPLTVAGTAQASFVSFEEAAPGDTNIAPGSPYVVDGFQFAAANADAAVFGPGTGFLITGHASESFLGFAAGNVVTLNRVNGEAFDLNGLTVGPLSFGMATVIDIQIDGATAGGGALSFTASDVASAADLTLGWTDLTSVNFSASGDMGLDDLSLLDVAEPSGPEPAAAVSLPDGAALLAGALAAVSWRARRRGWI